MSGAWKGLERISDEDSENGWEETSKLYLQWLYIDGQAVEADPESGERGRKGFTQ